MSDSIRILIVTDAWRPQVNGVVRTLETLGQNLTAIGHEVRYFEPSGFRTVPCPTYPEIRLALPTGGKLGRIIEDFRPHAIHIATEGPLGITARRYCTRHGLAFTTSFHTRYPEYVHARTRIPTELTYRLLRWFHGPAHRVMVATLSLRDELSARGFNHVELWSRGVNLDLFHPRAKDWLTLPRPIWLYVGRVAVEKNVAAFLSLDIAGTKLVIGDGPQLDELRATYPDAVFAGLKFGEDLAKYYAACDVFVFPSRTDTFGLVIVEALASGIPVAAFPVQGPADIIGDAPVGSLDEDLRAAADRALQSSDPEACRRHAMRYSWETSARQFLSNLAYQPDRELVPTDRLATS